jgi:transposase InsO family protein
MLAKVGELVLPAIEGSGPIEAWIIDVASTVSGLARRAAIACAQPTASIPSRWRQTCWIRTLSPTQPNQVWLADITYIPTSEGWLYLAVILDLFTRKVVGWAMRDHMRAELTIAALTMAIQRQRPGAGLVHHSDRGSQYAAGDYRDILQAAAIIQSMSRKGNCWDNAPMESFFGTLKTELVHHREYPDRDTARRDLFAYIEGYYNRRRIHSAIGYITPQQAEAKYA